MLLTKPYVKRNVRICQFVSNIKRTVAFILVISAKDYYKSQLIILVI